MSCRKIQATLLAQGAEFASGTPEELDAFLKTDIAKWARVVKEANVKAK